MKFFKDCLTGKDNTTFDIGRILASGFCIAYIIYPALEIFHCGAPFHSQDWAIGAAALLGGSGAFLYLKKETEPHND
jgi:hypothetical protein